MTPLAKSSVNLPNALTLLRLAALPLIIALFRASHGMAAAGLFVVVMLTDCLDGYLARKLNQVTRLGLYLDPVVDKIVIVALFYELAYAGIVAMAVPHLFLARELLQNAIRAGAAGQGSVVGANWMGKLKAVLQTICITGGLLLPALAGHIPAGLLRGMSLAVPTGTWLVLLLSWSFFAVVANRNRTALPGR